MTSTTVITSVPGSRQKAGEAESALARGGWAPEWNCARPTLTLPPPFGRARPQHRR